MTGSYRGVGFWARRRADLVFRVKRNGRRSRSTKARASRCKDRKC